MTGRQQPWSSYEDHDRGMKDAKGTSFMEDYTYNLVPGKEGILEVTYAGSMPDHRRRQDQYQRTAT